MPVRPSAPCEDKKSTNNNQTWYMVKGRCVISQGQSNTLMGNDKGKTVLKQL